MEELKTLVVAMTKVCMTATAYMEYQFAKEQGKLLEAPKAPAAPTVATAAPAVKAEKPARVKAEKSAPATKAPKTVEEALGQPETPAMSEKESLDVCYKLAQKYLETGDKEERKKALIAHLGQTYNKKNISGLSHGERMEFAEHLKALDAEPAAVGLGL